MADASSARLGCVVGADSAAFVWRKRSLARDQGRTRTAPSGWPTPLLMRVLWGGGSVQSLNPRLFYSQPTWLLRSGFKP